MKISEERENKKKYGKIVFAIELLVCAQPHTNTPTHTNTIVHCTLEPPQEYLRINWIVWLFWNMRIETCVSIVRCFLCVFAQTFPCNRCKSEFSSYFFFLIRHDWTFERWKIHWLRLWTMFIEDERFDMKSMKLLKSSTKNKKMQSKRFD